MKHLDLFSGIGGFALAARWMGWQTVQFVEIDPFCQKVLNKNFPNTPIHGDIKQFDGTPYRGTIDILTGGFPCQPYSLAGARKGTDDDRHLWPEMLRIIREVQPSYIVGENVYGLVNWSNGLVFDEVCSALENEGYQVAPAILPACGLNAPHRRDRVWFIAYASRFRHMHRLGEDRGPKAANKSKGYQWERIRSKPERVEHEGSFTNAKCIGLPRSWQYYKSISAETNRNWETSWSINASSWPTQSPVYSGNDGLPTDLVRFANHAAGNAIVPQVAFEIFKAIEATQKCST